MKSQNLVVFFADITGSTNLYETLGDTSALQKVGKCISVVCEVVEENSGSVIKTIGDGIMGTFPDADRAVLAADAIQRKVVQEFRQDTSMVKLRIGLHFGPVVPESGDIFGDSVNIAARLVNLANPGQILTSKATIRKLSQVLSSRTRDIGTFPIKGKKERMNVYEVLSPDSAEDPELTVAPGGPVAVEMPRGYLLLRYGEQKVFVREEGRTIVMGRDPNNEVVVNDKAVSRQHARIEYSNGKFVLEDQSTNGTFVVTDKGETIFLRRERHILHGNGQVSLGRNPAGRDTQLLLFACTSGGQT